MLLSIKELSVNFEDKIVLNKINLQLASGLYYIKGINGSGKSTLFKCIAQLTKHEGSITINEITSNSSNYFQHVSYCDAETIYPEFLTGIDVLKYTCYIRKSVIKKVLNYAKILNADYFLNQSIKTYSSGMLKKLSILQSLCLQKNNSVLLLDEPYSTLDKESVTNLQIIVNDWINTYNGIIIISNHHQFIELLTSITQFEIVNTNLIEIKN